LIAGFKRGAAIAADAEERLTPTDDDENDAENGAERKENHEAKTADFEDETAPRGATLALNDRDRSERGGKKNEAVATGTGYLPASV
jgi:hypothetical protein